MGIFMVPPRYLVSRPFSLKARKATKDQGFREYWERFEIIVEGMESKIRDKSEHCSFTPHMRCFPAAQIPVRYTQLQWSLFSYTTSPMWRHLTSVVMCCRCNYQIFMASKKWFWYVATIHAGGVKISNNHKISGDADDKGGAVFDSYARTREAL